VDFGFANNETDRWLVRALCATKRERAVDLASFPTKCQNKVRDQVTSAAASLTPFGACSLSAAAAMHAMNAAILGSKQLVVRFHEPKQLRQEKLAARFSGHNNHPRSGSGATSPAASEFGDWSPSHRSMPLGSPVMGHLDRSDNRARRSSGSYYHVSDSSCSSKYIRFYPNPYRLLWPAL
jgi:hypothetical protein